MTARLQIRSSPHPARPLVRRRNPLRDPSVRWFVRATISFLITSTVLYTAVAVWQLYDAYRHARALDARQSRLERLLAEPDLSDLHAEVVAAQRDLDEVREGLWLVGWARYLPYVGTRYAAGADLVAAADRALLGVATLTGALLPYEAQLGLARDEPAPPGEARLAALAEALAANRPALESAAAHLEEADRLARGAEVERLPATVAGRPLRSRAREIQQHLARAAAGAAWLPALPDLLGAGEPKRYLVLFQNDRELRATGGFLTSYAYLTVDGGRLTLSESTDIYQLARAANWTTPPPDYIRDLAGAGGLYAHYTAGGLLFQDANLWPDFPTSLAMFEAGYARTGAPAYDGVLTLNTRVIEALLRSTGPVAVPGYDEPFSVEPVSYYGQPIPQAVYQLELYAQRLYDDRATRKEVIGDLGDALLDRLYALPTSRWRSLARVIEDQVRQRHLMVAFARPDLRALADGAGLSGRFPAYEGGADFLALVDANYGINKADLFTTREIAQRTSLTPQGRVRRDVAVTYRNPGPRDRWLNGDPMYLLRLYVPPGSTLVSLDGGTVPATTAEEAGYTVVATVVSVPPGATTVVRVTYDLPEELTRQFRAAGTYRLRLWRQPGTDAWPHHLDLFGHAQELRLTYDTEVHVPLPAGP